MGDLFKVDWSKLPKPEDDAAADHLSSMPVPTLELPSTMGSAVDLSTLTGRTVVYVYPMTGRPDVSLPDGWDMIPGARGCTPQACAFRDHYGELRALAVDHLFGLSSQVPDEQREAARRLHLPFALLSDAGLRFANYLRLPRFETEGQVFLKRLTMIIDDGIIRHVLYPVFPPDRSAEMLMDWLAKADANPAGSR